VATATATQVQPSGRLSLFHSPWGSLLPFQARGVAEWALRGSLLAVWDTGLGKTVMGLALSALLIEDDVVDHVVIAAEGSKVRDWTEETSTFTDLTVKLYHGSKRRAVLDHPLPQVLVSTYETLKLDYQVNPKKEKGKKKPPPSPGPLLDKLLGKRVLVIYDEISVKLSSSSSQLYKAHRYAVGQLRKHGEVRAVGLTATPITRNPLGALHVARILNPSIMQVGHFEAVHIAGRDLWGNPARFANITGIDSLWRFEQAEIEPLSFAERIAPIVSVKSKRDSDVVSQFPDEEETFDRHDLSADEVKIQADLIASFESDEGDDEGTPRRSLLGTWLSLRQAILAPQALLRTQNERLLDPYLTTLGAEVLGDTPSTRLRLVGDYLERIINQGDQAIAFTFFGQSVLPLVAEALDERGITSVRHHGAMSMGDRQQAMEDFRQGKADVFLSSDAGARGLNLRNASYIVQVELPSTWSDYYQRFSRASRISAGDNPGIITSHSFIARETIEDEVARTVLRRNRWTVGMFGSGDDDGEGTVGPRERKRAIFGADA